MNERWREKWQERPLLTLREAAAVLGLSMWQTYRAVREGRLPSVRWGRRWLIRAPELLAWLEGRHGAKEG